jgi:hypothetical protein
MSEITPLLAYPSILYKKGINKKKIIDCGTIICDDDNEIETIEIITRNYNMDYYFDIRSSNCIKIQKLCSTIHGMIITLIKQTTDQPCIIKWKMIEYYNI